MPIQLPQQQFNVNRAGPALAEQRQGGNPQLAQQQLALQERKEGQQFGLQQQQQALASQQADRSYKLENIRLDNEHEYQRAVAGVAQQRADIEDKLSQLQTARAPLELKLLGEQTSAATAQRGSFEATTAAQNAATEESRLREMLVRLKAQEAVLIDAQTTAMAGVDAGRQAGWTNALLRIYQANAQQKAQQDSYLDPVRIAGLGKLNYAGMKAKATMEAQQEFDKTPALRAEAEKEAKDASNGTADPQVVAFYVKAKIDELAKSKMEVMVGNIAVAGGTSPYIENKNKLLEYYKSTGQAVTGQEDWFIGKTMEATFSAALSPREKEYLGWAFTAHKSGQDMPPGRTVSDVAALHNKGLLLSTENLKRIFIAMDVAAATSRTGDPEAAARIASVRQWLSSGAAANTKLYKADRMKLMKAGADLDGRTEQMFMLGAPIALSRARNKGVPDKQIEFTLKNERAAKILNIMRLDKQYGRGSPQSAAAWAALQSEDKILARYVKANADFEEAQREAPVAPILESIYAPQP
jgi:hypothetical protein